MSDPANTLPLRDRKAIKGLCAYSGCHESAEHGTAGDAFCRPHHELTKKQNREWRARQRKRLRRARLCIDCARPSGEKARCGRCTKARSSGVGVSKKGVGVAGDRARGFTKLDTSDRRDGRRAVERYVGRSRRGAPSIADRDDDLRADIDDAIAILTQIRDKGIAIVRSQAVAELGAIARTEAFRELAFQWIRVRSISELGAESFARGIVAEVDALRRESAQGEDG